MTEPSNLPAVWCLKEGLGWQLISDPVDWDHEDGSDVVKRYEAAGYCALDHRPAPRVEGPGVDVTASGLTLWVREQYPQCLIDVQRSGGTRSVYADRFPDGLDLIAKWAPIFRHGAPPEPAAS